MRPAGVRTTLAWHLRVSWRWLRTRAVLTGLALETWWEPDGQPDEWDEHAINEALAAAAPAAFAGTWVGRNRSVCPDGRADVYVEDLGKEYDWRMVDAFLTELSHSAAPREIAR